jgi:hypothetical protein
MGPGRPGLRHSAPAGGRERMSEDMRLRDFRPRTQDAYSLAVRQFMDRTAREPEAITDDDIRAYFLYLREDKRLAPSTIFTLPAELRRIVRSHQAALAGPLPGSLHVARSAVRRSPLPRRPDRRPRRPPHLDAHPRVAPFTVTRPRRA